MTLDWIIEADIYRLKKAAAQTDNGQERRDLDAMVQHKLAVLAGRSKAARTGSMSNA